MVNYQYKECLINYSIIYWGHDEMKAIIFDFDGTLPICFHAFKYVFQKYDEKELTSADIKEMFGPSETGIIRENLTHPEKEAAIEDYYEQYASHHQQFVENNKAMAALLRDLKNAGFQLGIFTGKARRSLDISLKELDLEGVFDVMITGDDVVKAKPDAEGLRKVLELLKVDASDAIYIGDSDADVQAGKQAQVYTIGAQWLPEYQTAEFTEQPAIIVHSIEQFRNSVLAGEL